MSLEENLKKEIKKWSKKLDDDLKNTKAMSEKGVEFLANIKAYQLDSLHFFSKGDLIRSYEALIWAWSQLDTGKRLEILSSRQR